MHVVALIVVVEKKMSFQFNIYALSDHGSCCPAIKIPRLYMSLRKQVGIVALCDDQKIVSF